MFSQCRWVNEPGRWNLGSDGLFVVTDNATDFWRETHYGFTRHSGHLFGCRTQGGFTATVQVRAEYQTLYDQAGIMVLADEQYWVKAGIELADGEAMLSSVLTIAQSDWATGPFQGDPSNFWIRATVDQGVLRIQASTDGKRWPLVRLSPFPVREHYIVGPMCCTPERAGLEVLFPEFDVTPPSGKSLHDLA
jgi:hypothetical protein